MNDWIARSQGNQMPTALHPDDDVEIRFRNGNTYTRKAADCDWSQTPQMAGDIVEYRTLDPIDIIKAEAGPRHYLPLEARNAYIVGPLALYVHEAPICELRKAMADLQRYFEVFVNATAT